jgi:hypothetical protein
VVPGVVSLRWGLSVGIVIAVLLVLPFILLVRALFWSEESLGSLHGVRIVWGIQLVAAVIAVKLDGMIAAALLGTLIVFPLGWILEWGGYPRSGFDIGWHRVPIPYSPGEPYTELQRLSMELLALTTLAEIMWCLRLTEG